MAGKPMPGAALDAVMFALKRSGGSADVEAICLQTGLPRRVVETRLWLLATKEQVVDDGGVWRTQDQWLMA